jgi:hypothetical protein
MMWLCLLKCSRDEVSRRESSYEIYVTLVTTHRIRVPSYSVFIDVGLKSEPPPALSAESTECESITTSRVCDDLSSLHVGSYEVAREGPGYEYMHVPCMVQYSYTGYSGSSTIHRPASSVAPPT